MDKIIMPGEKKHIEHALELSKKLITLAGDAEAECEHDGCLVLCGILRDCGYKIHSAAEQQLKELGKEKISAPDAQSAGFQTERH